MTIRFNRAGIVLIVFALTACQEIPLVPGADKVKFTSTAADVASCKAMGNVSVPPDTGGINGPLNALANRAVGLNANVVFLDGAGASGVAYRCQ
jgi:hypothetical protein